MFIKNFFQLFSSTKSISKEIREIDFELEDLELTVHGAVADTHEDELRLRNLGKIFDLKKKKIDLLYSYLEEISNKSSESAQNEKNITQDLEIYNNQIYDLELKVSNAALVGFSSQEKIHELSNKIQFKREIINNSKKEYATHKENLCSLTNSVEELNQELQELEGIYQDLTISLDKISSELMEEGYVKDSLGNMIKDKKVEFKILEDKYKVLLEQKDKVEKAEKEQKNIQNELKCENIKLKQELSDTVSRVHEIEKNIYDLKKGNSTLESINNSVSESLKSTQFELINKTTNLDNEKARQSQFETNKAILNSQLLEAQMKLSAIEVSIKNISQENESLDSLIKENERLRIKTQKDIEIASELLEEIKVNNEFKIEKKQSLINEVEEKQLSLSNVHKEVKDNKIYSAELENSISSLNMKVRDLEKESTEINEKLHKSVMSLKELEEERQRLLVTRNLKQKNNEELEDNILLNNSKISEEQEIIQKAKSSIEEIEKSTNKHKAILRTLNEKRDNLASIYQSELELFNERKLLKDLVSKETQAAEAQIIMKTSEIESLRYQLSILRDDITQNELNLDQKKSKKDGLVSEQVALMTQLSDFQEKNRVIEQKILMLEDEIKTKDSELAPLKFNLAEYSNLKSNYDETLTKMKFNLQATDEKALNLKEKLNLLVEENLSLEDQIEKKKNELITSRNNLEKLELEISRSQSQVASLKSEIIILEEASAQFRDSSDKMQMEALLKSDLYEQYSAQVVKINTEIANYKSSVTNYSEEIRTYDQKIIELTKNQNELLSIKKTLEGESNSYSAIVVDLKRAASKIVFENSESEKFIKNLGQKIDTLNVKKFELQGLIDRYEEEYSKLTARESALERELRYTQEEISELSTLNKELDQKISSKLESSTFKEMNLINMRQKVVELSQSKADLEKRSQEVKEALEIKEKLLSSCSIEINKIVAEIAYANNETLINKGLIQTKEDEVLKLEIETSHLMDELKERENNLSLVKTNLIQKNQEYNQFLKKREETLENLNKVRLDYDQAQNELERIKLKMISSQEQVDKFNEEISQLKLNSKSIESEIEKYHSNFEDVELVRHELESKYLQLGNKYHEKSLKLKEVQDRANEIAAVNLKYTNLTSIKNSEIEAIVLQIERLTEKNSKLDAQSLDVKSRDNQLNLELDTMKQKLTLIKSQVLEKENHLNLTVESFNLAEDEIKKLSLEYEKLQNLDKKLFMEISNYSKVTDELITKTSVLENNNNMKKQNIARKQDLLAQAKSFASPVAVSSNINSLKELLGSLEKKVSLDFFNAAYSVEIEEISAFFRNGINVLNENLYSVLEMFSSIQRINVRSSRNLGQLKITGSMKDSFLMGDSVNQIKNTLLNNEFALGFNITTTETGLCIDFKQVSSMKNTLRTN